MTIETMRVNELSLHPEALTTPVMNKEQYEALKSSIEINGQLDPATLYRGRIVDGRHRWLILQELGIEFMLVVKMANNSTLADIKLVVRGKETRRHETASQLAITAYRYYLSEKNSITMFSSAKIYGANVKRVGEAKKIDQEFGRPDILDMFFNGEKFNTGTDGQPFWTDSLGTVLNFLRENYAKQSNKDIGIVAREELTEEEHIIVNKFMFAVNKESEHVKKELASKLYSSLQVV